MAPVDLHAIVARVAGNVLKVLRPPERSRDLGFDATVAGRLAAPLEIRAVVAGIPKAKDSADRPRAPLERPGQRSRFSAAQDRVARYLRTGARRDDDAVTNRRHRFRSIEHLRDERLE